MIMAPDGLSSVVGSSPPSVELQPETDPPMNPSTMHPTNMHLPDDERAESRPNIPRKLAIILYTSHFLSTWNSRLFEFGSVLFLASIFPNTLLPMSIYALVRSAAAIVFAQPVGSWIDHGDRLLVVRTSIIGQRIAVASSCGLFWVLERGKDNMDQTVQKSLFTLTIIFACVEKLCSIMNLVSVERDWVVVITEGNDEARRSLNARMRRIDLLCKLLGPLAISTIAISSTMTAIRATLAMNLVAIGFEYSFIGRVYSMVPRLRRERSALLDSASRTHPHGNNSNERRLRSVVSRFLPIESLPFYFSHPAFLPSFALSLLYLTVLSFSGQMITYLISVGYTPLHVGIARTVSSIFELSATWAGPRLMRRIGAIRGGIWSLSWQMIWLAVGVTLLFTDVGHKHDRVNNLIPATGLAVGVALSRVGLWGYDLCAQNIIQEEVEMDHRGSFSAVETSFQNLFELISYATTIIFSRPDQFQWAVVISIGAVYISGGLYATFVRKRRGHLFHAPPSQCIRVKNGHGGQK